MVTETLIESLATTAIGTVWEFWWELIIWQQLFLTLEVENDVRVLQVLGGDWLSTLLGTHENQIGCS
jgi:hypothetical protein